MKYIVRYTIFGNYDSIAHQKEREYRYTVLGLDHWSAISCSADKIEICLHLEEEHAILFRIKFGATLDPIVEVT
jgi:hypothetical protein